MPGAGAGPMGPQGICGVPGRWLLCLAGRGNTRMNWLVGVRGLLPCPRSAWPVPKPEAAAPSLGVLLGSCHFPALPQGCLFPPGMEDGDRSWTLPAGLE